MSKDQKSSQSESGGSKILIAILGGLAFGFLLQKGGVANYNVLIGQLLLEDFTVVQIMLSAVVVGMVGFFVLHHFGKVEFHVEKLRPGANTIGGFVFGAGFALMAYCPGTGAAALGQGSWDVVFGMVGLIAGSYLFAEYSEKLERSVKAWGVSETKTLPDLLKLPKLPVALAAATLLALGLFLLHLATSR